MSKVLRAVDAEILDSEGNSVQQENPNQPVQVEMTKFQLVLVQNMLGERILKLEKKGQDLEARQLRKLFEQLDVM